APRQKYLCLAYFLSRMTRNGFIRETTALDHLFILLGGRYRMDCEIYTIYKWFSTGTEAKEPSEGLIRHINTRDRATERQYSRATSNGNITLITALEDIDGSF
ncbi:hypothetical protein PROFUN_11696, partial [Planoprotostelium fungivorum]